MDEVTSSTNECPAGETIKENNSSDLPVEKHQIPSKSTEKENDEISKCVILDLFLHHFMIKLLNYFTFLVAVANPVYL